MRTACEGPFRLMLLIALMTAGCHRGGDVAQSNQPVIAFVAASTGDAVTDIASAFHSKHKIEVKVNADDSSKLALQITQQAPAHVFLSANEKWADYVKEKGFALETTLLLGNTLVIVVPKGNPAGIHDAQDLAKPSLNRLASAGSTVPAGIYARQALKKS